MRAEPAVGVQSAGLEVLESNHSLLQSRFWAEFRGRLGWQALAFRCRRDRQAFSLLVLVRPLPLGWRMAYIPHGPEVPLPQDEQGEAAQDGGGPFLAALGRALRPHLAGCLFLRFDLPWGRWGEGLRPPVPKAELRKAPMDIQPPSTVVLELGYEEEALLAAMKPKTRYNIKLAEKKGVRVEEGSPADLEAWYELYRQTAQRDRITLHAYDYYRLQFELAQEGSAGGKGGMEPGVDIGSLPARRPEVEPGPPTVQGSGCCPKLKLLLARHEGELLAGIIVALHGQEATYLYGASSDAKRNLMPAYALQWEAIRMARRSGCRRYDLFGIPPTPDPSHPMQGLYRFKTGFGGRVLNRPGCWDLPYRPAQYLAYAAAERARSWYYRRFRKRSS